MSKYHRLLLTLVTVCVLFYSLPVNAATDAFDLSQAQVTGNSPKDIASWPITTTLNVTLTPDNTVYNFDKRNGADPWPLQTDLPGFIGTNPDGTPQGLQFTEWLFLNINGKWVGSGFIEMWTGRPDSFAISDSTCNLYYDSRWAPMTSYQFKKGEKLGFMVTAGDARNNNTDLKERSNIVIVEAPTDATDPSACPVNPDTGSGGGGGSFPKQPIYTPPTQGLPTDLGQLIQQIFSWSLSILGISVFVMFFYSGFLWLTAAGNTSRIGEAKTHMTNAIFGAILLLSSYLILYTINPDFVKNTVNLPGLEQTNNSSSGQSKSGTGTGNTTCDSGFVKYGNKKAGEICHFDILIPGSGIPPETECAGPDLACENLKCQVSGSSCKVDSDCPLNPGYDGPVAAKQAPDPKDYCGGTCQQSCSTNVNGIPGVKQ